MDAGNYTLSLQLEDAAGSALSDAVDFGEFSLERAVPTLSPPTHAAEATMGDAATLNGYDVSVRHGPTRTTQNGLIALNAGAYLDYTLYWQGYSPVVENYHAFVHLVDHNGQPIAQEDHLPGPLFQPPRLWNEAHRQPDVYLLRIPEDTVGGLYQPLVGMYEYDTQDRLPIFVPGEDAPRDDARLAPVKIVQTAPPAPAHKATAHFGELATLIGYDLIVPDDGSSRRRQFRTHASFPGEFDHAGRLHPLCAGPQPGPGHGCAVRQPAPGRRQPDVVVARR